ncbi:MAG: S8/S53 family peptidase [Phycisphaerales bacterium]|nr:S8/S53 family peptidase [Phycisphaerales bacterium]
MFLPQARQGVMIRLAASAPVQGAQRARKSGPAGAPVLCVGQTTFRVRPLLPSSVVARASKQAAARGAGARMKSADRRQWVLADPASDNEETHPWDLAHAAADELGSRADFTEPDLLQRWETGVSERGSAAKPRAGQSSKVKTAVKSGASGSQDPDGFWPSHPDFAWHLGTSQLDRASKHAEMLPAPTIVHLDTGYDPRHLNKPPHVLREHEWDVLNKRNDATDPFNDGLGNQPGHGTGTIGILAGGVVARTPDGKPFGRPLGGAAHANIIPVRISDSVIHLWTSTMGAGLEYVNALWRGGVPVDVVSISMGGFPTQTWADEVARLCAAGIVVVAAAGNRVGPLPPYQMVWPARFPQVIAAVGVTADEEPYKSGLAFWKMEGCTGPREDMRHALAAYTPNIPWARWGSRTIIDLDGGGTSSATPQIAAAAAHYASVHRAALSTLSGPARVEAIRSALFRSAKAAALDSVGRGILRADDALDVPVVRASRAPRASEASSSIRPFRWPLVDDLFADAGRRAGMFALETLQVVESARPLIEMHQRLERSTGAARRKKSRELGGVLSVYPGSSRTLRRFLASRYRLTK